VSECVHVCMRTGGQAGGRAGGRVGGRSEEIPHSYHSYDLKRKFIIFSFPRSPHDDS